MNVRRSGGFTAALVDAAGDPLPVLPGDKLRVYISGTLSAQQVVPLLQIAADADADRVTGSAPSRTSFSVTLTTGGFGAQPFVQSVTTDTSAKFTLDLAGKYNVQPNTNLRLDWMDEPWRFRVERAAVLGLSVRLYGSELSGTAPSGSTVQASLVAPGGRTAKATGRAGTFGRGQFALSLADVDGDPVTVTPGDILRLEYIGHGSQDLTIPDLTAVPDSTTDHLTGKAPAGARLTVSTAGFGTAPVTATVGAAGSYDVSFQGRANLVPGTSGDAVAQVAGFAPGLDLTLGRSWGVTQLVVQLGEADVTGVASSGAPIQLSLADARGRELAAATALANPAGGGAFGPAPGGFTAALAARDGSPVAVLSGETLRYRRAGETIDLAIPVLTGSVDAATDQVSGQAPAGEPVLVSAQQFFATRTRLVTATAEGRYEASFAGQVNLVAGTAVTVQITRPGGHLVRMTTGAATMRVWPEAARIDGTVTSGETVSALILPPTGNTPLASGEATANFGGNFNVNVVTPAGDRYYASAGQRARLVYGVNQLEMTIPPLGIEWDLAGDRVYGETEPGGQLQVVARPPQGRGGATSTIAITVPATGAYEADFAGRADLRPGTRLELTYAFANGNRMRVDRTLPWLNIQIGGNAVSGFALPRVQVKTDLLAGNASVGAGAVEAAPDAAFSLMLKGPGDRPAAITAGQIVEATFEARRLRAMVEPLSLEIDRDTRRLTGTGPISRALAIAIVGANGTTRNVNTRTALDGSYGITVSNAVALLPGARAEVSFYSDEGHRLYGIGVLPQLVAYVRTNRVGGQAPPLASASLTLTGPGGGAALAQGIATVGTDGRFLASLGATNLQIQPGQHLTLRTGAESTEMTVADVKLAQRELTLVGAIPAGLPAGQRGVQLVSRQRDGTVRSFNLQADANGDFTFNTANPPGPGAGLDLATVVQFEAVYTSPDGHQTVAVVVPKFVIRLPLARKR